MKNAMQQYMGVLAVVSALALASPLAGQARLRGEAVGATVTALGQSTKSGQAVLPDTGGLSARDVDQYAVPGVVAVNALTSFATGAVDHKRSSAQTSTQLAGVTLLNGLITAQSVIAVASSAMGWTGGSSNALGSGFTDLVIAGQSFGGDYTPAPNTRVTLPGVGYAILNEQVRSGDGVSATGMTVNMIRVVQQNWLGVTTGQIVVGSASSGVQR